MEKKLNSPSTKPQARMIGNPDIQIIQKPEVGLLDQPLQDYLSKAKDLQIGALVRTLEEQGVTDLDEKSVLTYLTISAQVEEGIFPYNRYLEAGSQSCTTVYSPDDQQKSRCLIWCNNHYLGLNRHPELITAAQEAMEHYGVGCGTSAVSGGFSDIHKTLENELAQFIGKEDAVLYPTGFTANLGAISTLASSHDLILFDRDCHASIIEGVRLSGATYRAFRNHDVEHLEKLLKRAEKQSYQNIFVILESVYSMSGEVSPLEKVVKLKQKYRFFLYLDEAHSFGLYGPGNRGIAVKKGVLDDVDFLMATLSKATAVVGGFIACSKMFSTYLRINSNSYMFQACLPPHDTAAVLAALRLIREGRVDSARLWANTNLMRSLFRKAGFNTGESESPIIPVYVSDEDKLAILCREIYKQGVFTNWVSYPAVKKGSGRLRFIVTANHSEEQVRETVTIVNSVAKSVGVL